MKENTLYKVSEIGEPPLNDEERDRFFIRVGWNAAFNIWWKYRNQNIDFKIIEIAMSDELARLMTEHENTFK
jgi:hypothetical protein